MRIAALSDCTVAYLDLSQLALVPLATLKLQILENVLNDLIHIEMDTDNEESRLLLSAKSAVVVNFFVYMSNHKNYTMRLHLNEIDSDDLILYKQYIASIQGMFGTPIILECQFGQYDDSFEDNDCLRSEALMTNSKLSFSFRKKKNRKEIVDIRYFIEELR